MTSLGTLVSGVAHEINNPNTFIKSNTHLLSRIWNDAESEYRTQRLKSASVKAKQLTDTGADHVVTSCHNCVDGLSDLVSHYKLDMKVTQLVHLVANALVI